MTSTNTDFWEKFMRTVVYKKTDFEENAENTVRFELDNKLRGKPSYGDDKVVVESASDWWDKVEVDDKDSVTDEIIFAVASGANGDNIINDRSFMDESFSNNIITPPDAERMFYGGNATSKTELSESDRMSVGLIRKVNERCRAMNSDNYMQPIQINNEKYYVMIMSPLQHHDMRQSCDNNCWKSIEENLKNHNDSIHLIFEDAFGIIDNVILHENPSIRLFNDYGPKQDMEAARALFLGNQAIVLASGTVRRRNICGIKKTKFKGRDYGVCTIDTAYAIKFQNH